MDQLDVFGIAAIVHEQRPGGFRAVEQAIREADIRLPPDFLTPELLDSEPHLVSAIDGTNEKEITHYFEPHAPADLPTRRVLDTAFDLVPTGRVLDIGCGAGRYLRLFRDRGYDTLGIDSSPGAIWVCKHRGLEPVRCVSIDTFAGVPGSFDIVLLLGHNLGIGATPSGVQHLLATAATLLREGGLLLANSIDIRRSSDAYARNRAAYNAQGDRHPGQTTYQVSLGPSLEQTFHWIHVSAAECNDWARATGLVERVLVRDEDDAKQGHWSGVWQRRQA